MVAAHQTSYDEMPYSNNPFYHTHPDCLGAVATLFGMRPPAVERCRVLELGCAAGGNLIPMAQTLPDGRFVGIDLSPRQVAEGRALISALGLTNIDLRPLSILDVDPSFGTFDYIICHGVYSWVPPAVQHRILAICRDHLAPNGVAYVSYNIYPGWHVGGMIRAMLRFRVRRDLPAVEQVRQARDFLHFVATAVPDPNTAYGRVLRAEEERLRGHSDTYFFHEYLEEDNHPLYFHEFVRRAAAHGLAYLGEARYNTMAGAVPPAELKKADTPLPTDLIQREQYLDFLRNRTFRRTLLCHADVPLTRPPSVDTVPAFLFSALAGPVSDRPDIHSGKAEEFRETGGETTLTAASPLLKAAFVCLFETRPRAVSFDTLWTMIRSRLEQDPGRGPALGEDERRRLGEALLNYSLTSLVRLHLHQPAFAHEVSARPVASPFARLQAAADSPRLTNLLHRSIEAEAIDRLVVSWLDGSRDRAALLELLAEKVANHTLVFESGETPLPDVGQVRARLEESLDGCLRQLAANALLVA